MSSEIGIGSMEEQALKRKERLKNLKRKAEGKLSTTASIENAVIESKEEDENADNASDENIQTKNDDVISQMETQLAALKAPFVVEEIDIPNLAPRKPDWDLKRDVSKKLEILEKKTQRAIAELIRERLKSNHGNQGIDLQAAVNTMGYSSTNKTSKIVNESNDDIE